MWLPKYFRRLYQEMYRESVREVVVLAFRNAYKKVYPTGGLLCQRVGADQYWVYGSFIDELEVGTLRQAYLITKRELRKCEHLKLVFVKELFRLGN